MATPAAAVAATSPVRTRRTLLVLVDLVLIVAAAAISARLVETDFGRLDVRVVTTPSRGGTLTGKLYRPVGGDADRPRPAVLALHGYQNDKETQNAFALELARRGIVVLALDLVGHGGSDSPRAFAGPPDPRAAETPAIST
ncbi:MAG: serine aminopeptidase domain-containing protein [Bacteroidales bacterium]